MVLALVGILSILRARQPAPDSVLLASGRSSYSTRNLGLIGLATLYALKDGPFLGFSKR